MRADFVAHAQQCSRASVANPKCAQTLSRMRSNVLAHRARTEMRDRLCRACAAMFARIVANPKCARTLSRMRSNVLAHRSRTEMRDRLCRACAAMFSRIGREPEMRADSVAHAQRCSRASVANPKCAQTLSRVRSNVRAHRSRTRNARRLCPASAATHRAITFARVGARRAGLGDLVVKREATGHGVRRIDRAKFSWSQTLEILQAEGDDFLKPVLPLESPATAVHGRQESESKPERLEKFHHKGE